MYGWSYVCISVYNVVMYYRVIHLLRSDMQLYVLMYVFMYSVMCVFIMWFSWLVRSLLRYDRFVRYVGISLVIKLCRSFVSSPCRSFVSSLHMYAGVPLLM